MFGERLKIARIKNNIKQAELGEILGVAGNTISNWEKGVSRPDLDTLVKISSILKVSPNSFLGVDDDKELTLEETDLLTSYSLLNSEGRKRLETYLADLLLINKYTQGAENPDESVLRVRVRK